MSDIVDVVVVSFVILRWVVRRRGVLGLTVLLLVVGRNVLSWCG